MRVVAVLDHLPDDLDLSCAEQLAELGEVLAGEQHADHERALQLAGRADLLDGVRIVRLAPAAARALALRFVLLALPGIQLELLRVEVEVVVVLCAFRHSPHSLGAARAAVAGRLAEPAQNFVTVSICSS